MKVHILSREKGSLSGKLANQAIGFIESALIKKGALSAPLKKTLMIVFLPPSSMKELNKKFLKKNKVTDVLAFAPSEEGSIGEIALCQEQINIQARKNGLAADEEAVYLILHGILHLLGCRHEEGGPEARKMYALQDSVFALWMSSRRRGT